MRTEQRISARYQLDKRLSSIQDQTDLLVRPSRGWLKAIREAIGMTTTQLAKRLGVAQSRVVAIEKAEVGGTITLNSLEKAARALECQLVYVLIPRQPLEDLVQERAERKAKKLLNSTIHNMALEDQPVDKADVEEQLKRLTQRLIEKGGSDLWEEDK